MVQERRRGEGGFCSRRRLECGEGREQGQGQGCDAIEWSGDRMQDESTRVNPGSFLRALQIHMLLVTPRSRSHFLHYSCGRMVHTPSQPRLSHLSRRRAGILPLNLPPFTFLYCAYRGALVRISLAFPVVFYFPHGLPCLVMASCAEGYR